MKLGEIGIGRKPDMSIDSTRNFRVLGQQIKKLWAKSCFKSEHENWRWKNDWFCRVSEIGLVCENACTYRLGLFRVYKWHYGLPPKPKNLPQKYTWTRVTAVFPRNLQIMYENFDSILPIFWWKMHAMPVTAKNIEKQVLLVDWYQFGAMLCTLSGSNLTIFLSKSEYFTK